jgi:hypothetical protein
VVCLPETILQGIIGISTKKLIQGKDYLSGSNELSSLGDFGDSL